MIHKISSERLTLQRVKEIIDNGMKLELSQDAIDRIEKCRNYLDR